MRKPWFRLNKLRIGWMPISWQGWFITFSYFILVIYNFVRIDSTSHSVSDTLINFIPQTILFTTLFSITCYFTSEKSNIR